MWNLKNVAKELKIITFSDETKGFDISDYAQKYGFAKLEKLIFDAEKISPASINRPDTDYPALIKAKKANKSDFSNFKKIKFENGESVKPLKLNELITETHKRFLNFPRKVGDTLFDQNPETGEIEFIHDVRHCLAWIMNKSNRLVRWRKGEGFVAKEEFFAGLRRQAKSYSAISHVPDYPLRQDVFYAHDEMPEPHKDRFYFNKLISFFNPASDADNILNKSIFCRSAFLH